MSDRDPIGLRYNYDYVIFDLSVLLFSSMFALSSGNTHEVNKFDIIRLVLQKTFKVIREWEEEGYTLGSKGIIYVYDKRIDGKYLKEVYGIDEYKSDRSYGTEDEVEDIESQIKLGHDYEMDIEEILELKDEAKKLKIKGKNFYEANKAKFWMLDSLKNTQISNIMVAGYEADDIFYILGKRLAQRGEYGLGISTDKDWVYKTGTNLDFYSVKYDNMYPELKEEWMSINAALTDEYNQGKRDKLVNTDLYSFGILNELCCTSHNAVTPFLSEHPDVTFTDFIYKIYTQDESLPDYEKWKNRYNAMHMESTLFHEYENELTSEIDKVLDAPINHNKLTNELAKFHINLGSKCMGTIDKLILNSINS